jgi:hypothetical protein
MRTSLWVNPVYHSILYGFDAMLTFFQVNILRSACKFSHLRRFRSWPVSKLDYLVTNQHLLIKKHELKSWAKNSKYNMRLRWIRANSTMSLFRGQACFITWKISRRQSDGIKLCIGWAILPLSRKKLLCVHVFF